jgi:hypothetical protein
MQYVQSSISVPASHYAPSPSAALHTPSEEFFPPPFLHPVAHRRSIPSIPASQVSLNVQRHVSCYRRSPIAPGMTSFLTRGPAALVSRQLDGRSSDRSVHRFDGQNTNRDTHRSAAYVSLGARFTCETDGYQRLVTSKGVEQSKELAEYLCNIDPPIERIYSSPFYRCLQTLKPTTDRLFREGKAKGKIRIDRGVGLVFHMREQGMAVDIGLAVNFSDVRLGNIHRLPTSQYCRLGSSILTMSMSQCIGQHQRAR